MKISLAAALTAGMVFSREQAAAASQLQAPQRVDAAAGLSETVSEEDFSEEDFLEEDLSGEEGSEDEADALIKEYLEQIGSGNLGSENASAGKVTDPDLVPELDENGCFRYTLPNGNFFTSTVPQGMVVREAVDIVLPAGAAGVVEHEDSLDVLPDSWHFTEPGSYHVKMLSYQSLSETVMDYNVYEVNFYFTILDRTDGRLGAVPAPEGFTILGASLDGQPIPVENNRCLFLTGDGQYEIRYADKNGREIPVRTEFIHDTTAPFLSFSQETPEREAEAPLDFYPSEDGCRISMSYNGENGYAVTNTLTAAGSYELRVEDQAGNMRSYHVRIRQTYDLFDTRIAVAGAVVLVGVILWMISVRRNMRVM